MREDAAPQEIPAGPLSRPTSNLARHRAGGDVGGLVGVVPVAAVEASNADVDAGEEEAMQLPDDGSLDEASSDAETKETE